MGLQIREEEEERANELIKNEFLSIEAFHELAVFFKLKPGILAYRNYQIPENLKYTEFSVLKRSGGTRKILAPISKLKFLQSKISKALYLVYNPLPFSHGFEKNRSIKTNALKHKNQKFILNIDLKDFFPSINFGRVRGMFLANPFHFNEEIATFLAQICCHQNELPQGAPTSPIISNIICLRLDRELSKFAHATKSFYSRYADDITFSTSLKEFPLNFGSLKSLDQFKLSKSLIEIIAGNGFEINEKKIKFRTKFERQIVTGLVVNRFPNVKRTYVRTVRAMLNAWDVYGLAEAEREYFERYDKKNRNPALPRPSFRKILTGKILYIGYIRRKGDFDKVYDKLRSKLKTLADAEDSIPKFNDTSGSTIPLVVTEGPTDWKHLKTALTRLKAKGKFIDLEIDFWEFDQSLKMSDSVLQKFCKKEGSIPKSRKYVCLFDRDVDNIIKEMSGDSNVYKHWGNLTYSLCLPIPEHRELHKNISIEMFYSDAEVNTVDSETGKMLLFTNQVLESTEINLTNKLKKTIKKELLDVPIAEDEYSKKIYDYNIDSVRDKNGKQVAHSKTVFASRINKNHRDFANFSIDSFEAIFKLIEEIQKI